MKMPLLVGVLVALAGCAPTVPSPPRSADERLVAAALAQASGRQIPVRCLDQDGLAAEVGEEAADSFVVDGQVVYDSDTGEPLSLQLAVEHCGALAGYARSAAARTAPDADVASALATLGHEYSHFVGDDEVDGSSEIEAAAECHSFQYAALLAPGFGADAAQAVAARDAVVDLFAPLDEEDLDELGEYVVGPECVDGGTQDLDAPGVEFPPVGTTAVG